MFRSAFLLFLVGCSPLGPQPDLRTPDAPDTTDTSPPEINGTTGGTETTATSSTTDDDCPRGVTCIVELPFVETNSTTGATSEFDSYLCSPNTDESGPEVVYQIELLDDGFVAASLSDLPAGVDVDVHILGDVDPDNCIDRGHWDSGALLTAGIYYVVVDSWVDGSGIAQDGEYTLDIVHTTYSEYESDGLNANVLSTALLAFDQAWANGETWKLEYAIFDYTLPSTVPRFFVLDLRYGGMLYTELATHGSGSQDPLDLTMAADLSNVNNSHASSMGLVRAAETYYGNNGRSLRLDGLEAGFNDNDRSRAIVVHAADYATQDYVDDYGYLGRSWGCPAIDPRVNDAIIDILEDGALLLKYWDDPAWLTGSTYL